MKNIKEKISYSFLFFLLIFLDQASKFYVRSHGVCGSEYCSYFRNSNFAFSVKVPSAMAYAAYAILLLVLLVWYGRKRDKTIFTNLGFVFILGGGLSNIGERILNGYVIDFIKIHTGVLNLADFFILAGIILLFVDKPKKV